MDLVTLLATAAETEHSETPFLVIGGALAVFAIVVGLLGIARPTLGDGVNRLLMGVGTLLVAGTMVSIVAIS